MAGARRVLSLARGRPRLLVAVAALLAGVGGVLAARDVRRRRAARRTPRTRAHLDRLLELLLQPGRRHTPPVGVVRVDVLVPPALMAQDPAAPARALAAVDAALAALAPDRLYALGEAARVVVAPRTDAAEAAALAADVSDRARGALEAAWAGAASRPGVAVGWAVAADDRSTPADLLARTTPERAGVA